MRTPSITRCHTSGHTNRHTLRQLLRQGWQLGLAGCLVCVGLWAMPGAAAAPNRVEPFTAEGWAGLRQSVQKPTVVVFTATYCPSCPAVFDGVAHTLAQQRLGMEVWAVVMDRAPGDDDAALLGTSYYRHTERLMAFDGPAAAVRHAVDPRWRGVTPFLVLLAPGKAPRTVVGAPSAALLKEWAQAVRSAR